MPMIENTSAVRARNNSAPNVAIQSDHESPPVRLRPDAEQFISLAPRDPPGYDRHEQAMSHVLVGRPLPNERPRKWELRSAALFTLLLSALSM